jgi:acetyl esterase
MDERVNPEMRAARLRTDAFAASLPPVSLIPPLDASRTINDRVQSIWGEGGPAMHESRDVWIMAQGRRVLCRLHRPNADPILPVLVWFHGGGWVWSSIDTHDRLLRELAAAGRVATLSVDYSLSPEAKFPRAVLEGGDVVRQVALQAHALGLDPSRIAVGGDSAGGNLALAAALHLRDSNGPRLRALLPIYPVTDAACDTLSYGEFGEDFGLTRAAMLAYWAAYLREETDGRHPLASPLLADVAGLPQCHFTIAELDVLRDDGIAMAEKMKAAGVAVEVDLCPGVLHGFIRMTEAVGVARDAVSRAGAFLHRALA